MRVASLVVMLCLSPGVCLGQTANAMRNNSQVESGDAGARAGTIIYNTINPSRPLPLSSGNVVPDTVRNMGAGQSPGTAWSNAARSNAGLPPPPPKPTPPPPKPTTTNSGKR
jgi:hypothetical protein